ncbi:unnamed protein product [Mycena citricolor]|uniref:C2H2-type domain-containing protein n=1 Tax=Mycena citricolor TaxID=2018698 RepID=A0AAD2H1Z2_9AGAR|nr:unnamed protein product [Mycena citricolor]
MSTTQAPFSRRQPSLPGHFFCKRCRRYYEEKDGSKAVHRRTFHQATLRAAYHSEEQSYTFERGADGLLSCARCSFQHHDPRALWRHVTGERVCPQTWGLDLQPSLAQELDASASESLGQTDVNDEEVELEGVRVAEEVEAGVDKEVDCGYAYRQPIPSPILLAGDVPATPEVTMASSASSGVSPLHSPNPADHPPIPVAPETIQLTQSPASVPPVEESSSAPIQSLEDWPQFDHTQYDIPLGPDTVTHDDDVDFERYNITINKTLRLLVCISCSKAIGPARLRRHILDKWPHLEVPDDIGKKLQDKYGLAGADDWSFPTARIPPVYGLAVLPDPYLFCNQCHHGYSSLSSLETHHYKRTCERPPGHLPGSFIGYGQTAGFDPRVVFPVDVSLLAPRVRQLGFTTKLFDVLPRPDYSHLPISKPVNSCNIDLLFKNEDFYSLVGTLTPEQVNQSVDCTPHTVEDKLISTHLDVVSRAYCKSIQAAITKSPAGLRKLMAQLGPESSREELRPLEDNSLNQYSAVIANIINTMLRAYASDTQPLKFPLNEAQRHALAGLRVLLMRAELPANNLVDIYFHRACFALFADEKSHGGLDNWVLPVNRYLVARCMGRETWIKANDITRICAKLQWLNRGVMLTEMNLRMPERLMSSAQAYHEVQKYLVANGDTPCSFIYEVHHTVKKIRDEYNDADPHNFAPGFCFLDIPSNGFEDWAKLYPRWLLSHPDLAERFTYVLNGEHRWKLLAVRQLLESFEELRLVLAIRCIVSCGPSVRAAEFARQSLRNLPGGAARNVVLLYRTLCLLAVLEKTSMQFSRKHCTPHCPVKSVSKDIIWNLAVFRPFEQFLISRFKGHVDAERYYTSMWPGIDCDFTSQLISTTLGHWTEQVLGVRLQIIDYRKIVSTFCRYIVDPFLYKNIEDSLFDELQNHTTGMSYMRYGVEKQTLTV